MSPAMSERAGEGDVRAHRVLRKGAVRLACGAACALALLLASGAVAERRATLSPDLAAVVERLGDDPQALRAMATDLVRADRVEDATLLLERALAIERGTRDFQPEAARPEPWIPLGLRPLALGLLVMVVGFAFLALRGLRKRGDLAVAIEYPLERRGHFNVRLAKERMPGDQVARVAREAATGALHRRASSRFEHTMVGRETQFRGVPARAYVLQLEGVIEEPGGRSRGNPIFQQRDVRVVPHQSMRIEFDLRPSECQLDVEPQRNGEPASGARVGLAGEPESFRPLGEGAAAVRLALPLGTHRIVVGYQDRVAEREIEIESLDSERLAIDLDDGDALVFRSCEAAVEPYVTGDLQLAANALERSGQREVAHLLRARMHIQAGETGAAALQFEAAGRVLEAAEVHAEAGSCERAAMLFERAGENVRAAEMHQRAADPMRAGRCWEAAGDLERAVTCYREAGAVPKLIDVLEKRGEPFEAGRLAFDRGEVQRAIRNLQQVNPRHPQYTQACRILAETLVEQDKIELALQKADEAVTFASEEEASSGDLFVWYGNLLDKAGRTERALRVFEDLQTRQPGDTEIGQRVVELEEKISKEQMRAGEGGHRKEIQRYEILGEIGRGGMGIVYKARDRRLGRIVALKRLPDNLKDHPRAVDLFLREARSAAALNHPNIVTLHDVDQEDGVYFLTMELLKGAPLHMILKKRKRLLGPDVARLAIQICNGLHYAHERGIVHRDVKTANLFFTNEKSVKIMDFGLAKMLGELRKSATQVTGTPYYMAPEQATGVGVDHRVDLYSLGVTLFELLTGSLPFPDGDILFQHKEAPPPDPRELNPKVPEPLAKLVLQLLAKVPDERGDTAAEIGERLQRYVDSVS